MNAMKQMYLLLICQGFYLGSVCQDWTFPSRISALIGSCVEIPCTYDPDRTSGTSSIVWYLYASRSFPEILNTRDSSSVMAKYRGRTSLVPGENSCTLRIDPVREGDGGDYYPGIRGERQIFWTHRRIVFLRVTDKKNVDVNVFELLTEGEATIIRCTAEHTCASTPPSLRWNKPGQIQKKSVEIYRGNWREESELTYIPSYVDDGSLVECIVTFPNGEHTGTSRTLNITYAPKNVTVTAIRMKEVMEGSDVKIQCNSFANPAVDEYEWYKGKIKLPDRGREITVRKVTRDMEPYSCAVRNRVGRGESAPTEIPVQYTAIGVHITVKKEHEFSELICDFLSSRPDVTHYTWIKDGSLLQNETEKALTINNNEENNGRYSCIAHNNAGNSSSEEITIKAEESKHLILLSTTGTICPLMLLMLALLVYACWRKRQKNLTSLEAEATYTDLRRSDITSIYDQLEPLTPADTTAVGTDPVTPADTTAVGSDIGASNIYENIHILQTFVK